MTDKQKDLIYWAAVAIVLALACYGYNAKAETAVTLGGWSKHLITDEDYNESHDAVLVEHNGWMAGRFTNSYDRTTYALAYGWSKKWGNWRGSVHAGVMRGYTKCYGEDGSSANICPMIYPAVTYTKYRVQPQVGLLGEAIVFSIRVRLY